MPQPVRALRVSYVGELGWELHRRSRLMPRAVTTPFGSGPDIRIATNGLYAVQYPRNRKGYKAWSTEVTNEN